MSTVSPARLNETAPTSRRPSCAPRNVSPLGAQLLGRLAAAAARRADQLGLDGVARALERHHRSSVASSPRSSWRTITAAPAPSGPRRRPPPGVDLRAGVPQTARPRSSAASGSRTPPPARARGARAAACRRTRAAAWPRAWSRRPRTEVQLAGLQVVVAGAPSAVSRSKRRGAAEAGQRSRSNTRAKRRSGVQPPRPRTRPPASRRAPPRRGRPRRCGGARRAGRPGRRPPRRAGGARRLLELGRVGAGEREQEREPARLLGVGLGGDLGVRARRLEPLGRGGQRGGEPLGVGRRAQAGRERVAVAVVGARATRRVTTPEPRPRRRASRRCARARARAGARQARGALARARPPARGCRSGTWRSGGCGGRRAITASMVVAERSRRAPRDGAASPSRGACAPPPPGRREARSAGDRPQHLAHLQRRRTPRRRSGARRRRTAGTVPCRSAPSRKRSGRNAVGSGPGLGRRWCEVDAGRDVHARRQHWPPTSNGTATCGGGDREHGPHAQHLLDDGVEVGLVARAHARRARGWRASRSSAHASEPCRRLVARRQQRDELVAQLARSAAVPPRRAHLQQRQAPRRRSPLDHAREQRVDLRDRAQEGVPRAARRALEHDIATSRGSDAVMSSARRIAARSSGARRAEHHAQDHVERQRLHPRQRRAASPPASGRDLGARLAAIAPASPASASPWNGGQQLAALAQVLGPVVSRIEVGPANGSSTVELARRGGPRVGGEDPPDRLGVGHEHHRAVRPRADRERSPWRACASGAGTPSAGRSTRPSAARRARADRAAASCRP